MSNPFRKHLLYLRSVLCHKYFVFRAGLITGVPLWRLIIHDWSKFLPCEWFPYADYFYGRGRESVAARDAFDRAWLHHIHFNPHHWQHWALRGDDGTFAMLKIPDNFLREMVADWAGAGRAIDGRWSPRNWYEPRRQHIPLRLKERDRVTELIEKIEARLV